jgi:hypothetical protein
MDDVEIYQVTVADAFSNRLVMARSITIDRKRDDDKKLDGMNGNHSGDIRWQQLAETDPGIYNGESRIVLQAKAFRVCCAYYLPSWTLHSPLGQRPPLKIFSLAIPQEYISYRHIFIELLKLFQLCPSIASVPTQERQDRIKGTTKEKLCDIIQKERKKEWR